jgi:prevent-host-death family protein
MRMRSLSQRELRNQSAQVLRDVAAGESFLVTNDGVPVAKLVPVDNPEPGLRISKPATGSFESWRTLPRYKRSSSVQEILDDLRADRF